MQSMTGFGKYELEQNGVWIYVSLRTVNSKYFDTYCKIPPFLFSIENKIVNMIKEKLIRGKTTVFIEIKNFTNKNIILNETAVENYMSLFSKISDKYDLLNKVSIDNLIKLPDVIETLEQKDNYKILLPAVYEGVEKAIDSIVNMRKNEGAEIKKYITKELKEIRRKITKIKKLVKQDKKNIKERFFNTIKELKIDIEDEYAHKRIVTEIGMYIEKTDVGEEIARIESHLKQANDLLKEEVCGRKLEFLMQEFHREINTLGVKCISGEITNEVVPIKNNIDRIKEQVLNIV